MNGLKIHLFGKYISLNLYGTNSDFVRDAKKNPNEINIMYNKWYEKDRKAVEKFNSESIYYSDYKGITEPKKIEIKDELDNCIFTKDVNDIQELLEYTKQYLYPHWKEVELTKGKLYLNWTKKDCKSPRKLYNLDITKKDFLADDYHENSSGLLFGGFKGEGVLKFNFGKDYFGDYSNSLKRSTKYSIFFDVTTFWDINICKPIIDNVTVNYDFFQNTRNMHTKDSFEPFTAEIIPARLLKLTKGKKALEEINNTELQDTFC